MAQTKTLSVPITGGIREDLSEHMAPPGTLTNAENVRFPIDGEVEARRGTTALAIATSADVPYSGILDSGGPDFLAAVPGGFVFGAQGYSYRYDLTKNRVHAVGSYANAIPAGRFATIASEEATYTLGKNTPWPLSVAVGGGYVAICWSVGNGQGNVGPLTVGGSAVSVKVQIYTEGGTLVTTYTTGTYAAAWVLYDAVTAAFILVAQNGTALDAAIITLAATGATLGAFVNVGTLTTATSYWAACPWPGIGWAISYQSAATTVTINSIAGTTVLNTQTFANGGIQPLSLYADATNVYAGWVDVGANCASKYRAYGTTLVLASGGDITIYTDVGVAALTLTPPLFGTTVAAPPRAYAVIGRSIGLCSDAGNLTFIIPFLVTPAGATTAGSPIYNMFPASGPFNSGMIWCRMRTPNPADFGNNYVRHVLLDYQTDRYVGATTILKDPRVALVGEAFADLASGDYLGGSYFMHLCNPVQKSDSNWIAGITRLVRSEQFTGSTAWGLAIGEWLEYTTDAPRQVRNLGDEVVVPGSPVLLGNDAVGSLHYGITPTTENQGQGMDLGFFGDPSAPVATQSDTANGALTLLGTYQCRSVLEFVDALGRRWRSAPSRIYSITMTGTNDTITHTCPYTHGWMRQYFGSLIPSGITRHIYRTVDKGSTFYRATPPQGAPLANLDASGTFLDTMNDGQLATREVLYTDGGVLNNDHPSSCRFVAIMEDRIWLGGLWDQTQIQSSKAIVPGEPPQFSDSPAFRVVLPHRCTGLAAQDGVLIAFCEDAIYAIQGSGPNDQGQGAWDAPRVITRSTGCINELSILETSSGIFFQSARGIEILPRGLGEPQFIGSGVQDSLGSSSVVATAVIKSETSRTARFCIGGATVLVFDLDSNAWSRDVYPMNVAAICDTESGAVIAMKAISGGYGFLLETPTAVNDSTGNNPQAVQSTLQWAAVRPFGIAGQGRFTGAIGMFDEITANSSPGYQTANATLFLTVDTAAEPGKAYDMGVMTSPDYRKRAPLKDSGSAAVLKLTTAANGWRFMGWTLELDDSGGGRRMAETEQG